MSEVKVNKVSPRSGTGVTLGDSGDTFTVPSGATLDIASGATLANSGTATGFASIAWQSSVKTANFTAVAGEGYFVNTSGGAITLTLPASPSIGDEVSFVDYAGTFDSNNLTIARNSSKIAGADEDLTVSVERAANTLVFTDSTQGWLLKTK